MFDTPYNRMIAEKVKEINMKYARSHPVHSGYGRSGALEEANASLMFNPANSILKSIQGQGKSKTKKMMKHEFKPASSMYVGEEIAKDDELEAFGSGAMARGRRRRKVAIMEGGAMARGAMPYKKMSGAGMGDMIANERKLGGAMARGQPKKMTKEERGQAVKKLMKEHGCSLGEASRMLKQKLEGKM